MRFGFALAALMLPLSGCVPPPAPGYNYYPQPGYPYPQAGYPYPQEGYSEDFSYPGYAWNEGAPSLFVGGVSLPLIFYDGGWGYWDRERRWHRAPAEVSRHLDFRRPGGVAWRPGGPYW